MNALAVASRGLFAHSALAAASRGYFGATETPRPLHVTHSTTHGESTHTTSHDISSTHEARRRLSAKR